MSSGRPRTTSFRENRKSLLRRDNDLDGGKVLTREGDARVGAAIVHEHDGAWPFELGSGGQGGGQTVLKMLDAVVVQHEQSNRVWSHAPFMPSTAHPSAISCATGLNRVAKSSDSS